jgi:hypothetical protein
VPEKKQKMVELCPEQVVDLCTLLSSLLVYAESHMCSEHVTEIASMHNDTHMLVDWLEERACEAFGQAQYEDAIRAYEVMLEVKAMPTPRKEMLN